MNNWEDSRGTRTAVLLVTGLLASPLSASAAGPEDPGLLAARFTASLGSYLLSTDTTLALNGSAGNVGTEINLERDLGLKGSDRFRVDLNWRMTDRQHLRALFFDFGSENTRRIESDLVIGDTTFPAAAELTAGLDVEVYEIAYEYALLRRDNWEILGSLGAHVLDVEFYAGGQGSIGAQVGSLRREAAATAAPLPVLGLRWLWRFAPDWYLEAQGQYFKAKVGDYDGNLHDVRAGVTWMFSRHVGVGAGYNRFGVDVVMSQDEFRGSLDWTYSGAQVYVTASF